MSTYRIDDSDGAVQYSKPASGGHWSKQNSGSSYQNGLMLTRTRNANATLSFTGTSISVYGLVSPRGTGGTQSSFYSVDGQNSKTYTANPSSDIQSQVLFYNSGTLSNGQHTLVLINLVELDYLWIDYFEITTSNEAAPSTGGTTAAPPSSGQVTSQPAAQPAQTQVVTQVLTSVVTESSTTRLSVVTTVRSNVVSVGTGSASSSVGQSVQSSLDSVSNLSQPSSSIDASQSGTPFIDAGSSSAAESRAPIGAIVGGVLGGIAVIILAMILFLLLRRRRQGASKDNENDRMLPTTGPPANVVPFVDAPSISPTGTSSAFSQPSSRPSDSQYGGFNQSHMGAGHSGTTYNPANSLPGAVPIGKRQYSSVNEEANSSSAALLGGRQKEMEQIHSSGPSLLSSTSGYSDPLSYTPMALDDLPPSYQAAAASQTGENPVLQGLANAPKS